MNEGQQLGKYTLQQRLGRGGMAEVWKALDTQLQREVAIKIMRPDLQAEPDFLQHFKQEAQIVAALNHPNIVKIFDFETMTNRAAGDEGPIAYMVMEYIHGQTLAAYIASTSRRQLFPSPAEIVRLFTSISLAIDYAHQKGMIHRDLKPSNILLDARNTQRCTMGEPMITDFGIAKLVGASTGALTRKSIGTPFYMSPEQAQGRTGDQRSDIYSLGIMLYEMCTGVVPFKGENELSILMQHLHEQPTSPVLINPQVPPALAVVILRCLSKEPALRFPTASSLTAAIAEAFGLPVPPELHLPAFPPDHKEEPMAQSGSGIDFSTQRISSSGLTAASEAPTYLISSSQAGVRGPVTPIPPVSLSAATVLPSSLPPISPAEPITPVQSVPIRPKRRLLPILLIGLIVILLLGGLSAALFLTHQGAPTSTGTFSGRVTLVSSGNGSLVQMNATGVDDELAITIQNIPQPAAGKVYALWLLPSSDMNGALLVGKFTPVNGQIRYFYQGDQQHTDLLTIYSRLLITLENPNSMPVIPSFSNGVYHAAFSTKQGSDGLSIYDHLQHLTAYDPELNKVGIFGGLNTWLYGNTARVWGWAINAQGYWQGTNTQPAMAEYIRGQIIHILDVVDGKTLLQKDGFQLDARDTQIAQIGLIDGQGQTGDFIDHVIFHLTTVAQSPGVTLAAQKQITQIVNELSVVKVWLEQVRTDAKTLIPLSEQQYAQTSTLKLLNEMALGANYAYNGQTDPTTGQVIHAGIRQISQEIQQLATWNLQACPTNAVCTA